ncbi:hypothetical protein BVRB_3g048860 [Beta vulgaris subsp. vulgaris]|nr:hypothetical protein BVRB_3g048860 [Beta vulgaris subsp. vulgaris]
MAIEEYLVTYSACEHHRTRNSRPKTLVTKEKVGVTRVPLCRHCEK